MSQVDELLALVRAYQEEFRSTAERLEARIQVLYERIEAAKAEVDGDRPD